MGNFNEMIRLIKKGVNEIVPEDEFIQKLKFAEKENRKLVIKLGLDPTSPDIHIGHAVVIRKLKLFQDLGHQIVIIIGDYTGMIGDPTGKSETRKQLTKEQVEENAETYKKQLFKILDKDKTIVKFNSEWLSLLEFSDVIKLCGSYTVAKMLEREDFKNRYTSQTPIYIHEFLYPLMQGYDSVAINSDIELGGTDQRFNVLMGRTLQKVYLKSEFQQVGLFMPILEGLDGKKKMSKSLGNYVGIDEAPNDMYGKIMSIPDNLILRYFELATDFSPDEILKLKIKLEDEKVNPMILKKQLAKEIVKLYHSEELAENAENNFFKVSQKKELPQNIEQISISKKNIDEKEVFDILLDLGWEGSKSDLRRLITQGGLKINSEKYLLNEKINFKTGDIIQFGKRRFIKIDIV